MACADHDLLFQDWQTQWNCLTLATMATYEPYPHDYSNSDTAGDTAEILEYLAVPDLTKFDAVDVFKSFHACANGSSALDGDYGNLARPPDASGAAHASMRHPPDIHAWGLELSQLCDVGYIENFKVDPDLAGPGVVLAYILAHAIVFYAWLCIRILHIASSIDWFATLTRYKGRVYSLITFQGSRLAKRIDYATSTFIVELQEAQCFFISAVQIGLLYAASQPAIAPTDQWQSFLTNRLLMRDLTIIAVLPLLLNQVTLYKLQLGSYYSLLLCTLALVMSFMSTRASVLAGLDIDAICYWTWSYRSKPCGGKSDITAFCRFRYYDGARIDQPEFLMAIAATTLGLIWFKKLWAEFAGTLWLSNCGQEVSKKRTLLLLQAIQLGRLLTSVLIFISEVIFIGYMVLNLISLSYLLEYISGFLLAPVSWSVGQIVSVLVWAPAVSKYVYLLIFGVERSFAIRLSKAFAVIRHPDKVKHGGLQGELDDSSGSVPGSTVELTAALPRATETRGPRPS
ncbi:hypothetical protein M419DRAFT_12649 [Trichoderma reesei RUT C-30]|uniref:Uncharacterized protein n=1 Tax=Hypocrea jecorina (strain ATCC 56765 / BCRC 32924 / NRRL 11460 / Rut C-30) TaxID=1344414 RepID=A0A024RZY3_HYPJR|nr:hypothetical protein M419DRAFT_12649 [Trichoderma reesei RUT C-30]